MAPDKPRKSKINKEQLILLLRKIGQNSFPTAGNSKQNTHLRVKLRSSKVQPYLTSGKSVNQEKVQELESKWNSAFQIPREFLEIRRKRGKFRSLHTYRSRLDIYKLERLFISDDFKLPGKSMIEDIDPEYYTIVAGRQVKERGSLEDYNWAVKNLFLTRMEAQRLEEEMATISKLQKKDEARLKNAEQALQTQVDAFNRFLEEDYKDATRWLAEAEAASLETAKQLEMEAALTKELEATECRVVLLEEKWEHCQLLQKFLYSVSPLQWRRLHDHIHKKISLTPTDGPLVPPIQRFRGMSMVPRDDASSQIAKFIGESRSADAPALYFTHPQQLFDMLQDLEEKNLEALLQCTKLQPSLVYVQSVLSSAQEEYNEKYAALEEDVREYRKLAENEEAKVEKLKKEVEDVVKNQVKNCMLDKEAIWIVSCLEDAYERVIGPNDSNLDPLSMMRALEAKFHDLCLQLDILPADLVQKVKIAWEKEDKRILQEAKVASKKVHQMDMLVKKFSSALKPWTPVQKRRLVKRSQPPKEKPVKVKPAKVLTAEELQQLRLFGDIAHENAEDFLYRPMN